MSDYDTTPVAPEAPADPPAPDAPADDAPADPSGTGDPEAVAAATADHEATVAEHTDAIAQAEKDVVPWVNVASVPAGQTTPAAPTGEDAEVHVSTHDGVSFFHTIASLPAHLKDAAGNVIFGKHLRTTIDGTLSDEEHPNT